MYRWEQRIRERSIGHRTKEWTVKVDMTMRQVLTVIIDDIRRDRGGRAIILAEGVIKEMDAEQKRDGEALGPSVETEASP